METLRIKNSIITADKIIMEEHCIIGDGVRINVRGTFHLGKCSVIQDNCKITCQEFYADEYLFMASGVEIGRGGCNNPDSTIKIGKHVGIFENTVINVNSPVTIGDDVGIGAEVMIWTHGAWLDITQGFPADFGPVTIGNNVWLPAKSIMLPNTSIGDNTVIGIGSIITKHIPSGCLAAGIPCKVLRSDCYPKTMTGLEKKTIITDILNEWLYKLAPHKNIKSVTDLKYNVDIDAIELHQNDNVTFYYIDKRVIEGYNDVVSEDLRDYLRRRGIKYFTGKPFKSIHI
jgi:acetyltransferase-like isoleucine patch superfamily enzyme